MAIRIMSGPIIRAGQALSEPLDCTDGQVVRIHMPADWTPAPLSFQICADDMTWNDLFNAKGEEVVVPVVAGTAAIIEVHQVRQVHIRFRSGWRYNPQPQAADREFMVAIELVAPGGPKES